MIEEAQREGSIELLYALEPTKNCRAFWDSFNRVIVINSKFKPDTAAAIHSIIFELQNAASTRELDELTEKAARGLIARDAYVEGIEWIEHQNALKTKRLLNLGIAQKVFPPASRWDVPESFAEHLAMQRYSGHSDFIARRFDMLQRNRLS